MESLLSLTDGLAGHAFDLLPMLEGLQAELQAAVGDGDPQDGVGAVDEGLGSLSPLRPRGPSTRPASRAACCAGLWARCTGCLRRLLGLPVAEAAASIVTPSFLCDRGLGLARAHRGFLAGYLSIRRDLLTTVRRQLSKATFERRPLALYVTGHSLGGALASLAILDLRVALQAALRSSVAGGDGDVSPSRGGGGGAFPSAMGCYTFGAPCPGNSAFRTLFNVLAPVETFRIVARQDVVTALPPGSLGFRQAGREAWLDATGEPAFCMSWSMRRLLPRRRRLSDHRLSTYLALLSAKYRRDRGRPYVSATSPAAPAGV